MEVFVSLDDQLKQSDHGTNKTVGNHREPSEAMVINAFQILPKNSLSIEKVSSKADLQLSQNFSTQIYK